MSWLARSIANSLKFEDDDEDANHGGDLKDDNTNTVNDISKSTTPNPDSPNQHSPSSTTTTPPRGVKEDLTALTSTFTRQLWGVASFLAPPPESDPRPISDADTRGGASDENDDDALIAGIRSDFAEIGGRFKTEISKLSGNKAVSEITKIASNFLQFGSEGGADDVDLVGVTDEVVAFARDVAMHPETWLDFPIPDDSDFEDFDMSDAQQEHALAVERLAPRLAALRMELCPGYMSDGCFWKIYFVLLHPRLSEEDAELLSTPQIVEARAMLSHDLKNKAQTLHEPVSSGIGLSTSKEIPDLPREQSLSVPSHQENESLPIKTSGAQEAPLAETETCSNEDTPLNVATEVETEKHPVQSTEILIIDKAMVEEEPFNHTKHQHLSSSSSSKHLDENFEDDGDDWLKEDGSEMVTSGTTIPLENDEDVSFSDLEDDDEDAPTNKKKVTSGSDSSAKGSRDWVQLSKSSAEAEKDIKHAQNSGTKESNDWLDVDDIEIM